ncbi:HAD family hydrolase [Nocardia salmonicida]|uniref:HAD family hydrolase n=1 Tax=Nocardia salmonicida TaxID=53431 RepID=UPI0037A51971
MTRQFALFDLDDTLVDTSGAYARWAAEFTEHHRLPADSIDWLLLAPKALPGPKDRLLTAAKSRFALRDTVDELWSRYRRRMPELIRTRPGVLEGLERLRNTGWILGIVTNGAHDNQLGKILSTGLAECVNGICISGEVGLRKPDPRIFHLAARRSQTESAVGGWMIGDDPDLDIRGGQAAGMKTCWVTHDRQWESAEIHPDTSALDTQDAIDLLLSA